MESTSGFHRQVIRVCIELLHKILLAHPTGLKPEEVSFKLEIIGGEKYYNLS